MWLEVLLGGAVGGAVGVVGAFAAAGLQLAARRARNRALHARGAMTYKDEVFHPLWIVLGPIGAAAGLIAQGLGAGLAVAAACGSVLPVMVAATSIRILRQGR